VNLLISCSLLFPYLAQPFKDAKQFQAVSAAMERRIQWAIQELPKEENSDNWVDEVSAKSEALWDDPELGFEPSVCFFENVHLNFILDSSTSRGGVTRVALC